MLAVSLRSVSFSFGGRAPVLNHASHRFERGFTGLVGPNGAGKSTLLQLLASTLAPDEGEVRREPRGLSVALCPQEVEHEHPAVEALGAATSGAEQRLRAELALDPSEVERWSTLSPGERKRWQIAAALAAKPDVLLLDEPTNHVDGGARSWLERALADFRGIGVIVSHDRALLDRLTQHTLRIAAGALSHKPLPYTRAHGEWERERRQAIQSRARAQAVVATLQEQLGAERRARDSAEHQRSRRARSRSRHDSDARGMGAQTRADWAEARKSRQVAVTRHALERARTEVPSFEKSIELGRSVFAHWERPPQPVLASLELDELRVAQRVLLREVRVVWRRDDRVVVTGDNGVGKSTLLTRLCLGSRLANDRLLVLPQELSTLDRARDLMALRGLERESRGRVLSIVAALGLEPERVLASGALSPGEGRKLRLALGLGRGVAGLVLDEPTNHLDLSSIERVEAALRAFPGAILLATHDQELATRVASTEWRLCHGRVEAHTLSSSVASASGAEKNGE